MALQHLRSSTANKRPTPAAMSDGQLAMNTNLASPGLFLKDSNGDLVKVGPVHVGTTAPNATPASGGQAGNSVGEQWLDTSSSRYVFKIWDGTDWRTEDGEFVNVSGDTMTGALVMDNQQQVRFRETTANGTNFIAIQAPASVAADRTLTLPDVTGTVVSTGDTGTVTSTMILDGTILNADVNASAAIAGTKISPNFGSQTVTTTGVISPALGTAAAPSIAFTGDLNTGIYSPGADQLAVATNGTQRIIVDANGNVGVGVATPANPVDVLGSSGGAVVFNGRGRTSDNIGVIRLASSDSATEYFRIQTASSSSFVGTSGNTPLLLNTNGSERLRITSAGLVGIGTSSPSRNLDIAAGQANVGITSNTTSAGNEPTLVFTHAGNNGYVIKGGNNLQFASDAGANVRMTLTTAGSLGIGTTSPSYQLDVAGQARFGGANGLVFGVGNAFVAGQGELFSISTTPMGIGTTGSASLQLYTNSSERARIDSSGRLLVGTSTAFDQSAPLQVNSSTGESANLYVFGADNSRVNIGSARGSVASPSTLNSGDTIGGIYFRGHDGTSFKTGAQIQAQIDGITPSSDLPSRLVFSTTADGASSPTERMRITSAGYMLIGNISSLPSASVFGLGLLRDGTGGAIYSSRNNASSTDHIEFFNPNGKVGSISTNASATAYNTSSDYRLKENVTAVTDGINRLQQLKPSRFNFIADPNTVVDGFLAHEVQDVVPEAITGEKDAVDDEGNPQYQGIDQSKLVPLLTAALQEAIGEIESLKARVVALESA